MMTYGNFWKFVGATLIAGVVAAAVFMVAFRVVGSGIPTLLMVVAWYVTCFAILAKILTPKP